MIWDFKETAPDLDAYRRATKREELEWLKLFVKFAKPPKRRVKYLLLIVSKVDLWYDDHDRVLKSYQTAGMKRYLDELAKKVAVPLAEFKIVTAAAEYDSFKGIHQPSAVFSKESSDLSIDLLRGLLCLLQLDGNL